MRKKNKERELMADEDSSTDSKETSRSSSRNKDKEVTFLTTLAPNSPKKAKDRSQRQSYDPKLGNLRDSEGSNADSDGGADSPKSREEGEERPVSSKASLLKKSLAVENVKERRARSSSMSSADGAPLSGHSRESSLEKAPSLGLTKADSGDMSAKGDFHKFQPKTTGRPLTCKVCNKYIWGAGGYTCSSCKCAVHSKQCAAKAREERGCPKPLLSSFLSDEDIQRIGDADLFKINMPEGKQKCLMFSPTLILADLLAQIDFQQRLKSFVCFDGEGKPQHDTELPLSKMKTSHVYYVPKGMPLAMVPGLLGFGQTIQLLAVKSAEEHKSRRSSMSGAHRPLRKQLKKSGEVGGEGEGEGRKGVIHIQLKHARSLVVSDDFEFVYVIIASPNTEQHFRSIPIPFSPNPDWNQPFKVTLNNVESADLHLKIWATSKNGSFADSVIGQLNLEVKDFADGDSVNKIYTLKKEPRKLKANKAQPGQLRVKWKFVERHFRPLKTDVGSDESDDDEDEVSIGDASQSSRTEPTLGLGDSGEVALESKPHTVTSENLEGNLPAQPKKKKRITDVYEFGAELGVGAYSVVKVLYRKDNRQSFACKILDNYSNMENAEEEEQNFHRETTILKKLNHPNICRIYDVFKDRKHYYVVLENVAGGELFDQLMEMGCYDEAGAAPLIKQMFSALSHIHSNGFAHRDIKPENLLFSDDTHTQLKIVDFGEAKSTKKGALNDYVGTPDYMAPEVVKGANYSCKVDCWSAGVVVYILLCGFPPFEGESEAEVYINIMNIKYSFTFPEWDKVSEDGKGFIRALLQPDEKRMSADEALKHPWMLKFAPK